MQSPSPPMRAPAPLSDDHDLSGFDSGRPQLDDWLRRHAAKSDGRTARTYVICAGQVVIGYYCLAAGAVMRDAAPSKVRRNAPDQIPVVILGRLAVDRRHQRQGLGSGLLRDAVLRTVAASETIGVRALLVHALDDDAARFYSGHGFLPSPIEARTFMLPIETAIAALR